MKIRIISETKCNKTIYKVQPTYSTKYQYRVFNVETKSKVQVYGDYMGKEFKTYEEAELACLIKLIEIVKNK
jgi:hypothetical protein